MEILVVCIVEVLMHVPAAKVMIIPSFKLFMKIFKYLITEITVIVYWCHGHVEVECKFVHHCSFLCLSRVNCKVNLLKLPPVNIFDFPHLLCAFSHTNQRH